MKHNRNIIYLAGFLFSIPMSLAFYINSSFLSLFASEKMVGIIYTLGSVSSILALLLAPKIFKRWGSYKFLLCIILLDALSLFAFAFVGSAKSAIPIFILGISMHTLIIFSLDELLKIFSKESSTGKVRGIYLAICHLAMISAQLASGTFLGGFSFRAIFVISSLIMMIFLIIAFFGLKNIPDPKYDNIKNIKYVKGFFKNVNLFRAYCMSLLIHFFYCWMIIYTPIYLSAHLGFSWSEIGIIFAIMLVPFLIIPIPMGKYGDKFGERLTLMFAFALTACAAMALFFIEGHYLLLWASMLFITRVGAASVEVMSDSYFFKHIKSANEEFVGVYRSASPVAYIVGPIIAFVFFTFIPSFSYIYVVLGAVMLSGIYLASTIKKGDI